MGEADRDQIRAVDAQQELLDGIRKIGGVSGRIIHIAIMSLLGIRGTTKIALH